MDEKIIKRVIGLPGETIEFKNDVLYVNGKEIKQDFLDEQFVKESKLNYNANYFTEDFKVKVGQGEFFVMGDNRNNSIDSRMIGYIDFDDEVVGRVFFKVF